MTRRRGRLALGASLAILGGMAAAAAELDAAIGRALFRRAWLAAPASTRGSDGLGPLFNARACTACHAGLDRNPVVIGPDRAVASPHLVLRLSDPAGRPDPVYGRQLQLQATAGVEPEAAGLAWRDGRPVPVAPAYGPFAMTTRAGGRLATSLRGLGLLEAVPDAVLEALAARPDAPAGRVNWVTDAQGARRAGRFGQKACEATLAGQVEQALSLDLGLSSFGRSDPAGDCTLAQRACRAAPQGGSVEAPEIPPALVAALAAFLAAVPPPEVRPSPARREGDAVFAAIGCAACHLPALPSPSGPVAAYTDLLLHDLGPELDGGATEPGIAATEWRTAPLWGLSRTIAAGAGLLHDGRATSVTEAIALHGGAAAPARTRFEALAEADRRRLVAFVEAL